MKHLLPTLLLSLFSLFGFSQNCKLTGTIIDKISQEPIPYANAILMSVKDSSYLKGAISNEKGVFIIENIKAGTYNLELRFIGYQTVQFNNLLLQRGTRDIGETALDFLNEGLDEVTIKSTKSAISYKVDKKVINAGSFPGANVAMDLLENIPSLQVDFEGKLSYRGDGTFKVFINGQGVPNGEEKLRQLSADKIDRIEVITNPSAKYDSEGTAGIIQVILKKNRLQGYAINTKVTFSSIGNKEWSFSVDQKSGKRGWHLNGHLAERVWQKSTQKERQVFMQGDNTYITNTMLEEKNGGFSDFLEFGFNYDLTEKDYIEFAINVNPIKVKDKNSSEGSIREQHYDLSNLERDDRYSIKSEGHYGYQYVGARLNYKHAFNKDQSHLLSANFDYSAYLTPYDEKNLDEKTYPTTVQRVGYKGTEHNEIIFETDILYTNKLSELSSFETGFKIDLNHIPKIASISGVFNSTDDITSFANEPKNQEVDFAQDIYASFITFKSGWGKFEYQLGLRAELTDRKSNYSFDTETGDRSFIPEKNNFIDVFPSIHTLYNFSETHQLSINFSRRVNRPSYWNLIPISQYQTPYLYYTGNGELLPAYSNNYEIAYKKSWNKDFIGAEFFMRNTTNVIQNYSRKGATNTLIESPENVGNSTSIGAEIITGIDLNSWWNLNVSSSLYSYKLLVNLDNSSSERSLIRGSSRVNNTFILPKDFTLKWDFNYNSPQVAAQTKTDGYFYSNIAVKKSFKENKWLLSLSYSNMFDTRKYSTENKGVDFSIESDYVYEPVLSFRLSYNFDNQK